MTVDDYIRNMADFEGIASAVNLLAKVCGEVLSELAEWTRQTVNEPFATIDLEPLIRMNQAYSRPDRSIRNWYIWLNTARRSASAKSTTTGL